MMAWNLPSTLCTQNIEFLDAYGAFLAEYGDRREAITVLQKACSSAPDVGFEKFMYVLRIVLFSYEISILVSCVITVVILFVAKQMQVFGPGS